MKKTLCTLTCLLLTACGTNSDGSLKSTYSSCKIISSNASLDDARTRDLTQCWTAPGDGYESKGDAMQWCTQKVDQYLSEHYRDLFKPNVKYIIESSYCR